MKYDPLVTGYNRGWDEAMAAQSGYAYQEKRRFTAAVAAMQGMWANHKLVGGAMPNDKVDGHTVHIVGVLAVKQADALLKELEK